MCSKLPAIFALFHVLVRPRAIKVCLPLCEKNTRLSTPAQLQCLHSGAWESGNEAVGKHCESRFWPQVLECSLSLVEKILHLCYMSVSFRCHCPWAINNPTVIQVIVPK